MKKTILFILFLTITNSHAQQNIFGVPQNSATTQSKMDIAKKYTDQAYIAYADGNIEKSKYFIDQSQKDGFKSGDFYYLLGAYMYRTNELKAAKRYWNIAYKEGGCWECKEYLEKLKNKEPLENILLANAKNYVEKLNAKN
ncbi:MULTISPECIES: hypothetical protein [Flavobacterium]|uniref:hypothetical protein n=1 Tax=Flavobacterium TaxID=237 RepID=UPI0021139DE8|nr:MULTISPECIES: hypothetical protein [Flavobacterium]UUF15422.1 hypothetical protein NLJ00_04755 [Flavobacterium panici]